MAATGHIVGRNCSVKIVDTEGTLNLSAHGNSVDIEFSADDIEVSAYGDSTHTYTQGLTVFSVTFNGWWAGSHATDLTESAAACMRALVGNSASRTPILWVSPAGSTAGSICYVACVNVQSAPVSIPTDGIAGMTANFSARAGSMTACADSIWT